MADRPLSFTGEPIEPPPRVRVVVVQAEDPAARPSVRLPVAVVPFGMSGTAIAIVVKLHFGWRSGDAGVADAELSPQQPPPSSRDPDDFVPRKVGADVIVVGQAKSAAPARRIEGRLVAAGLSLPFVASSTSDATRIPFRFGGADGAHRGASLDPGELHEEGFDWSVYNAAPPALRAAAVEPGSAVVLEGLVGDGRPIVVLLPAVRPVVTVDTVEAEDVTVEMTCDTLSLDVDADAGALIWRGSLGVEGWHDLQRIVVSLEPVGELRSREARASALMRGHFGYALGKGEPIEAREPEDDEERDELRMQRYQTWLADAPSPRLGLEVYAKIAAALAEWPDRRAETLSALGLDDDAWSIEERAWLERLGRTAMAGDMAPTEAYGARYAAEVDALASDAERAWNVDEYAALHAEVALAELPDEVLAARGIGVSAWTRMERRWTAAADADPRVRGVIDAALAAARARRGGA